MPRPVAAALGAIALLAALAGPAGAQTLRCGETVTQRVRLATDLECNTRRHDPALRVVGPRGRLDLAGHTIRCRGGGTCVELAGRNAKLIGRRGGRSPGRIVKAGGGATGDGIRIHLTEGGRHKVKRVVLPGAPFGFFDQPIRADSRGNRLVQLDVEGRRVNIARDGNRLLRIRVPTSKGTFFFGNRYVVKKSEVGGESGGLFMHDQNRVIGSVIEASGGAGLRLDNGNVVFGTTVSSTLVGDTTFLSVRRGNRVRSNTVEGQIRVFGTGNVVQGNEAESIVDRSTAADCAQNTFIDNDFEDADPPCIQ